VRVRALAAIGAALATLAVGVASASAGTAVAPRISELYPGGGDDDAPFENDFVELKNLSNVPFVLTGASLQSASATGTTWEVTALSGAIPADGFFLVGLDSNGTDGNPLPTPDAAGTSDLQLAGGKIALVFSTTALTGACPTTGFVDLVGWGNADCAEGTAPGAVVGPFFDLRRDDFGCTDTDDNEADFTQTGPPVPENSSSPAYSCANDPPVLNPIGPQTVDEGTELVVVPQASDPDGDVVTLSASNLPAGASFNDSRFEWTPSCTQAGTYPGIHFEARDPENATDFEDVTITVNDACGIVETTITLTVAKKGKRKLLASGAIAPPQLNGEVSVSLLRKRHGDFKRRAAATVPLEGGDGYKAKLRRPKKGKCRVVAEFEGSAEAGPSSATKTFRCRKP
jgi:Putative Ig domain